MSENKEAPEKKQFDFAGQHEGEEVYMVFHQHPIVMRKALIAMLLIINIGIAPLAFWPLDAWARWLALGSLMLALLIFFYRWISWYYSLYIVTDERLIQIKQQGLFDRRLIDIGHRKIQSVNYEIAGIQATLLHYGTIVVQTFVGDLILRYIHNPVDVHRTLVKIVRTVNQEPEPEGLEDI